MATRSTFWGEIRDSDVLSLIGLVLLVLVIIVVAFGVWYFFYGYHEHYQVIVTANPDGLYKRWSMRRIIETYVSDTSCTTDSDNQRRCSTDYSWEAINFADTSGIFKIDEPVEPPTLPFRICQRVVADAGCERERLVQHWQVRLKVIDRSDAFWCDVTKAQWDDNFGIETIWRIDRNRAQGWLCGSLRK